MCWPCSIKHRHSYIFWGQNLAGSRRLKQRAALKKNTQACQEVSCLPAAYTSSRMASGSLVLFLIKELTVLPSSLTSPTGSFPCTVLYK
mmetsp:Transcript_40261/g.94679  ORF Transcript_40261/g.94679 Transcript_40261/m.94679 type:complete len:89 (-) Transcript_40261:442-708(-)